jgi:putative endonuclease
MIPIVSDHTAVRRPDTALSGLTRDRRARERAGRRAEWIATLILRLKGYRILARRARTPSGELDLVVARGRRIAFVEVKQRTDLESARASLGARQTRRMHRAAACWLDRHRRWRHHDIGFDAVLVTPWGWPAHLIDALQPQLCAETVRTR